MKAPSIWLSWFSFGLVFLGLGILATIGYFFFSYPYWWGPVAGAYSGAACLLVALAERVKDKSLTGRWTDWKAGGLIAGSLCVAALVSTFFSSSIEIPGGLAVIALVVSLATLFVAEHARAWEESLGISKKDRTPR